MTALNTIATVAVDSKQLKISVRNGAMKSPMSCIVVIAVSLSICLSFDSISEKEEYISFWD